MKITHTKSPYDNEDCIDFEGKYIEGRVYDDGSGELSVIGTSFFQSDSTHKNRAKNLRKFAQTLLKASKELDQLELKLKQIKDKKKSV